VSEHAGSPALPGAGGGELDAAAADEALALVRWLLACAGEDRGIALTETGALNRALVREAVSRRPEWWDTDVVGPPYQEAEIRPLAGLHALLGRGRLLRRRGRRLLLTARGRELQQQPAPLLETLGRALPAAGGFEAAVGALAIGVLLSDGGGSAREIATAILPALIAQGWRADEQPPVVDHVRPIVDELLWTADAAGLVRRPRGGRPAALTEAGRFALRAAMSPHDRTPATTPRPARSRSRRSPHAVSDDRGARPQRWWLIDVLLLYGGGWEAPAKPPGRRLLAAGSVTLAELAHAIDLAFARWDHSHLHSFELGNGSLYILGGHDDLDPPAADSQTITLEHAGLARIGAKFTYTFDLGDDWTHACEVLAQDDPPDFSGAPAYMRTSLPVAIFGWGTIPDQYGRLHDDDQA